MACNADDYRHAWEDLVHLFGTGVDYFAPYFAFASPYTTYISPYLSQKTLAAFVLSLVLMAILAILFKYARTLVSDFVKWYYNESITEKAREYFRRKCIGTGMNLRGARVSISLGVIFYF